MTTIRGGELRIQAPVLVSTSAEGVVVTAKYGEHIVAAHNKQTNGEFKRWKSPLVVQCEFTVVSEVLAKSKEQEAKERLSNILGHKNPFGGLFGGV